MTMKTFPFGTLLTAAKQTGELREGDAAYVLGLFVGSRELRQLKRLRAACREALRFGTNLPKPSRKKIENALKP